MHKSDTDKCLALILSLAWINRGASDGLGWFSLAYRAYWLLCFTRTTRP